MVRRRLVLGTLLVVLFGLGWFAGRGSSRDLYSNLDLFVDVVHKVQTNYVDPVDSHRLVEGALKGLLHDLDPYSQYLDEKSYANLQNTQHGSFGGIGVEVGVRNHFPTVISPMEGTPAWEAGLRSGDVFISIDGHPTEDLNMIETADRLRGPAGTKVTIEVAREDEPVRSYTIQRRIIETRAVPYAFMLDRQTGYLRLANFNERSGQEVRAALEKLRAAGAKALVLDLQQNPGGLLDQAVDVAEQFLPARSLVVYTHGRAKNQDTRYYANESRPNVSWPMVVLVDDGSASAAEIVAGALQDLDRALVMGRTSFGKGSVQSVFPLPGEKSAVKLTTALYYTPSGRSIHKPVRDTLVADAADEGDEEPVHEEAPAGPRPSFHTQSGRIVHGGGGIMPDVTVATDTLVGLTQRVESAGLAFKFANHYLNTHPAPAPEAALAAVPWTEFVAFLREEKVPFEPAGLAETRPALERAVRREMARRMHGNAAAARIAVEGDRTVREARAILGRARAPRDVFAATRSAALPGSGAGP